MKLKQIDEVLKFDPLSIDELQKIIILLSEDLTLRRAKNKCHYRQKLSIGTK